MTASEVGALWARDPDRATPPPEVRGATPPPSLPATRPHSHSQDGPPLPSFADGLSSTDGRAHAAAASSRASGASRSPPALTISVSSPPQLGPAGLEPPPMVGYISEEDSDRLRSPSPTRPGRGTTTDGLTTRSPVATITGSTPPAVRGFSSS
jgi:hypothetical protein